MLILLPKARNGLHKLETNLKNINFGELSNEMVAQEVVVFLPKFKIEFSINLNNALKKVGQCVE
jgi:serpin B